MMYVSGLRCYVCDSRSVIGYYDAEKDCNTDRSLQECPDVKVTFQHFMAAITACDLYNSDFSNCLGALLNLTRRSNVVIIMFLPSVEEIITGSTC